MSKRTKQRLVFRVLARNNNSKSVDYGARWHVVASNVEDAMKKVKPLIERGEEVIGVECITWIDVA